MPSKSKPTPTTSQEGATDQLGRMTAFNGDAMEVFAQACQAYVSGVATLNGELMGFVSARLSRDAELSQAVSLCGNWSDAVNLQQRWAQQATQAYLAEASRLTEMASKVAKENWEPVYDRAGQIMTELNKTAK
ncbi:MAG: phasin family protein [Gammaproteobacteria bacterium]